MKKIFSLFFISLLLFSGTLFSQVDVTSSGGTPNASYTTLKAAFDAINAGTHTGIISIGISNNTTETASASLNSSGTGSASYSKITISPTGGASRTISGTMAAPLIDLNGADNVKIDGLNSGGNSLTISNLSGSSATPTSTIRFLQGATNDTVTNCTVLGSSTSTISIAAGTILFHTTTAGIGNNNNTISFCNIGPAGATLPSKAITGVGTVTSSSTWNTGNTIDNNNIYDFFLATNNLSGIYVGVGNQSWVISNNRLYQTSARTFTSSALRYGAITVSGNNTAGSSHTITGNIIGFGNSSGTGTTTISGSSNEFRGIDLQNSNTSTYCSIQGNIISGINQTTSRASTTGGSNPFIAIQSGTPSIDAPANIGNITGNTIGSLDGSSTIVINATSTSANTVPVCGILDLNFNDNISISNNNIGSITINNGGSGTTVGFRGILVSSTTGITRTISNNTIGGTASGSITDNIVGSYGMYGLQVTGPNANITGNTIRNMTGSSKGTFLIVSAGILASGSTGVNTISQNVIHSLVDNSDTASSSIYGMSLTLPSTANIIERNFIHSLTLTGTNATNGQIWGIYTGAAGTATYKNNMIRLGLNSSGTSITTGFSVIGIRDAAAAGNSFYNNTVYIGGTGVTSISNTYCFLSTVVTVTRNFQNNIFWNARSNGSGTIANVSIRVGGTAPNPAGLTCNYNLISATGVSGVSGVFNGVIVNTITDWRTATGQDAKSFTSTPLFINANGNSSSVDLHIQPSDLSVSGRGTYITSVTNDFDGNSRATSQSSTQRPVDVGADQYTPSGYTGNVLSATSSSVLSDGNLKAIELTSGTISFAEARQFTGVRTPNNSMLKYNNSPKVNKKINTVTLPDNNFRKNTDNFKDQPVLKNETENSVDIEAIESTAKKEKLFNYKKPANVDNNKRYNELNGRNYSKNGSSGGNTDVTAVNTPWIYWEIDNLVPTDPVTLRFYYNDDQMATISEADLKLSFWNGSIWDDSFTQSVDVTNNFIEITLPTGAGWPSTSLFAIEDQGAPLPVVLSSFDIAANNRNITLNWVTESEINNKGFSIERRLKTPDAGYNTWKEISFVNGKGNSNISVNYTYTDSKLNTGAYQYRLKQVDFNGNYEYHSPANNSDIVIGKPGTFDISQNYPNPSNPKSKIDFQMPFDGKVSIKVYDILGREVASLINEYKPADFYTVEFDGTNISSGTYFYRIIAEGDNQKFTKTLKMILVK